MPRKFPFLQYEAKEDIPEAGFQRDLHKKNNKKREPQNGITKFTRKKRSVILLYRRLARKDMMSRQKYK